MSNMSASPIEREAADRLGIGDAFDRGFGDVGGDRRILGAGAEAEQAEARHQHQPRRGVVHGGAVGARFVAREIGAVVVHELLRRLVRGAL